MANGDPFELGKKYNWSSTQKNTRSKNTAAGAAVGAGEGAAIGGAIGVTRGIKTAKGGLRDLKLMGAAPEKATAAKLIARGGAVKGAKGAVALGAFGAGVGALTGATERAKRKKVSKAADEQPSWTPPVSRAWGGSTGKRGIQRGINERWEKNLKTGAKAVVKKGVTPIKAAAIGGAVGGAVELHLQGKKKMNAAEKEYGKQTARGKAYNMSTGKYGVAKSAFGIEHKISKAQLPNAIARGIKGPVAAGQRGSLRGVTQAVNPINTAAKPSSSGSLGARLDAAKKAKGIIKSAFGVEHE